MARGKYLKMSTPAEIRKSVNRVANMVVNDQITEKKANAIIYAANACLASIRTDEYEKRISELEELVDSITEND